MRCIPFGRFFVATVLGLAASVAVLGASAAQAQSSTDLTSYTQWDDLRRPTLKIGPDPDGPGSLKRRVEKASYDALGRVSQIDVGVTTTTTGSDLVIQQTTKFRYDLAGNKTQVYANSGTSDATLTQISYDAANRPQCTAVRMNAGIYETLWAEGDTPDACTTRTMGAQGPDRITKTTYDLAGQAKRIDQAVGTGDTRVYARYEYTDNGKQREIVDANGNRTTLTYDGFDRLDKQIFPSTTRPDPGQIGASNAADYEQSVYDAGGNRLSLRKRDGNWINYGYDALNRMTGKSGAQVPAVGYSYDLAGQPSAVWFGANGQGVTYAYDTAGRKLSETTFGRTISYCYGGTACPNADKVNPTRVSWPDGNYITYAYDYAERQQSANAGGAQVNIVYDDLGRRTGQWRSNGASEAYGFDAANRLTSWTLAFAPAGSALNQSDTLGYNPASQIASETRTNNAYLWAATARSLSATADGLNRDQAIATIGGGGCAAAGKGYDCNGSLTNDGARTFVYDGENRLTTMSGPADAALEYDPLGRLAKTTINGVVTQFLYDGDQLVAEYDAAGTVLRRYVHGAGTDDPLVWFEGAAFADPRYLHADRQGSIVAWSNAAGVSQATYTYGPYGEPGDNWAAGSRFRYTGQAALPELKLYHYKARVYDPARGWFLQTDPIGYKDDLDLYAYTGDDPVNRSDPTGTEAPNWAATGHGPQVNTPNQDQADDFADSLDAFSQVTINFELSAQASGAPPVMALGELDGLAGAGARVLANALRLGRGAERLSEERLVIGKMRDIGPASLRSGEFTLPGQGRLPNKGSPSANWKQNAGQLRQEMGKGRPIRDGSVDAAGNLRDNTGFTRAERSLLSDRGWTYNKNTNLWVPPKSSTTGSRIRN